MENFRKYSFKKYSRDYPKLFSKERCKLNKILLNLYIEHVGSSSVIGLSGKGIIDIAISVPKSSIQKTIRILKNNGYEYLPNAGDKERKFFQRIVKCHKTERRVHVQLTYFGSHTWKALIAVRNYLNLNSEARKQYEKVKKEAVKYAKGEGKKYRKYKKSFLDKLEKQALKSEETV